MAKKVIPKAKSAQSKRLANSKRIQKKPAKKAQSKVQSDDPNVKLMDQVPEWRIPKSLFSVWKEKILLSGKRKYFCLKRGNTLISRRSTLGLKKQAQKKAVK